MFNDVLLPSTPADVCALLPVPRATFTAIIHLRDAYASRSYAQMSSRRSCQRQRMRSLPQALVAAAELADRLAIDAIDVAQLQVFADDVYQRLMAVGTSDGEHHEI